MLDIYFNFIKDSATTQGCTDLLSPLHYNLIDGQLHFINSPCTTEININGMEEDPFINVIREALLPYVRHFPGRVVRNLKLSLNDDQYIVISTHFPQIIQQWFGLTIYRVEKKLMPIQTEIELSKQVYQKADQCFQQDNFDNFIPTIQQELSNYYEQTRQASLTESLARIRRGRGEEFSLEKVITPTKDCTTKWDFFMTNAGAPLTGILRYYHGGFFKLDLGRGVSLLDYKDPLEELHNYHCRELGSCYTICRSLGSMLNIGNTQLRHLSTFLENAGGTGFTFIEEGMIGKAPIMFILDIKNKLPDSTKYADYLFGNERVTLELIRDSVIKSINPEIAAPNDLLREQEIKEKIIFEIVKKVIKKKAII